MKQKMIIATFLAGLGVIIYLLLSQGPSRVHYVKIPVHLLFLATISLVCWGLNASRSRRFLFMLGVIAIFSVAATYLDSLVIYALVPLHLAYFAWGFLAFSVEAVTFLVLTYSIDRYITSRYIAE